MKKTVEKSNENQKLYIVGAVIIVAIIGLIIIGINGAKTGEKIFNDAMTAIQTSDSEKGRIIYIRRTGCSWCEAYAGIVKYMVDNYGLEYVDVDTSKLSSSQQSELLAALQIDPSTFGTPHMTYVKDSGATLEQLAGYNDQNDLFNFLKNHNVISNEATLPLNYLDYAGYKELIASTTNQILVIGQPGCGYCEKAIPILDSIAKEYNLKINYFSTMKVQDGTEFQSSLAYLTENEWGTPLTIIVSNNEVVSALTQLNSKENYVAFFKENGFITE